MLFSAFISRGTTYRVLFEVALKTGMRQGELLALTWGDLDLVHAVIHVRRTYTDGDLGSPKVPELRLLHGRPDRLAFATARTWRSRQVPLSAPVGVHDEDVRMTVALADERDLSPVR